MGAKESKPIYCCYLLNNWKYEKYISIAEFKELFINYTDFTSLYEYLGFTYRIIRNFTNCKESYFYGVIVDFPNNIDVKLIANINIALKEKRIKPYLNLPEPLLTYIHDNNSISMSINFNKSKINSGNIFYDPSFTDHITKTIIKYIVSMNESNMELPIYVKNIIKEHNKNEECIICKENFKDLKNSDVLFCGHMFCNTCISKIDKCPICRMEILKK